MTLPSFTPVRALAVMLAVAAVVVLAPFWAPLVLAAWLADLLRPLVERLERALRGRSRAAAAAVVLLVLAVVIPLVGAAAALASGVTELLEEVRAALEGHGSLAGAVLGETGGGAPPGIREWATLASRYGTSVWVALSAIARASASVLIAAVVFIAALYTFVVDGKRAYAWLESNAPIPKDALRRLANAFRETGRGLIIAGGGVALVQGAVATITYVALGIPRALLLGPVTAICSFIPVLGTGLVWVPLGIELFVSEQIWQAVIVVAVGAGVESTIDNFLRPVLARFGRLALPTFLVLVSILGGIAVFGAAGALLGPLVVRLCMESLAILSDEQSGSTPAPPGDGARGHASCSPAAACRGGGNA